MVLVPVKNIPYSMNSKTNEKAAKNYVSSLLHEILSKNISSECQAKNEAEKTDDNFVKWIRVSNGAEKRHFMSREFFCFQ